MEWRRVRHEPTGISCEIGRLNWREKPLVAATIADVFGPFLDFFDRDGKLREGVTRSDEVKALRQCVETLDEQKLRPIFERKIRNVEGLEGVTSGAELYEEAPDMRFIIWLLHEMVGRSSLSEEEGKASGSPSTSSTGQTGNSGSPAPSTGPEGGPSPSTVPETQSASESSSQVA